jgi:enoyl-CoA hydratase
MAELILVETRHHVGTIIINRPDKLNALRAFVAGADIGEIAKETPASLEKFASTGQAVFSEIEGTRKPVIAAVNGFAFGGGCELALACHVRVASTAAKFGLPEVKLGLIPGYGGTQRLPRLVGRGAALRLIMSGEAIDGTEAHRIGLAEMLAEPDKLMDTTYAFADACAKNGPVAVARAIEAVDAGLQLWMSDAMRCEAKLFASLGDTSDMREGTQAFLEKRTAHFRGE